MGARKSHLLFVTTGIVLSLCLLMLSFMYTFVKSVHFATLGAQKEIKLEMFFKQDLQDPEEIGWIESLRNRAEILKIITISQSEAQESFKGLMQKDWGGLVDEASLLGRLPASLVLEFQTDISSETRQKVVDETVTSAAQFAKYDGYVFQKDWAQWFAEYTQLSKNLAIGLGIFVFIILYFIVSNLTRSKVTYKADEIEILSFLGATPWQIEKPFIVQSSLVGALSAILSTGVLEYGLFLLKNQLLSRAHIISPDLILTPNILEMMILVVSVSVLCGWAAKNCVQERLWA